MNKDCIIEYFKKSWKSLIVFLFIFGGIFLYFSFQKSKIRFIEQKVLEQEKEITLLQNQVDGVRELVWKTRDNSEKIQNETEKQFLNILPTLQLTKSIGKTDNWNVYENQKFGFKFKIPPSVSVDKVHENNGSEITSSFIGFKNNGKDFIGIYIHENTENESLWHYVHRGGNYVGPAQFKSFVGEKTALVDYYHENEGCDHELCHGSYIQFVIENENNFYVIKFQGDEKLDSVEEAILLSFEFVK